MTHLRLKIFLIKQIYSTVRWRETLVNMDKNGIKNFIEIGPGKALTGMVKRTINAANCFSINSITDIKSLNDKFKDKKVLITGATGGIGRCILEQFDNLGAKIVASGTNEQKLGEINKEFPKVFTERFKLDEHSQIEGFIENVNKKLNGLDILINNAGITMDNLSIRLTEENWKKYWTLILLPLLMCKFSIKKC